MDLKLVANTMGGLSMDGVQAANSGHPEYAKNTPGHHQNVPEGPNGRSQHEHSRSTSDNPRAEHI